MQTKVWLEIRAFFLMHGSLTYETRCSTLNAQICHWPSTKPLITRWLGNYGIARSMKCSVISHSCLKKPLCCCQIVCGDIKTSSEFSAKNEAEFLYLQRAAMFLGSKSGQSFPGAHASKREGLLHLFSVPAFEGMQISL